MQYSLSSTAEKCLRYRFLLWSLMPSLTPPPILWKRNTVLHTVFDLEDQPTTHPQTLFKFHRITEKVTLGGTLRSHLVPFLAYSRTNFKLDQLPQSRLQLRCGRAPWMVTGSALSNAWRSVSREYVPGKV